MNRRALLVLTFAVLAGFSYPAGAQGVAPSVPVQGQLLARNTGTPAPGLTVFLIHQALGRSTPSYSDGLGRFGWVAIPVRPEPYFIEVYWGQNLIYRQPVLVNQPLSLPPLRL